MTDKPEGALTPDELQKLIEQARYTPPKPLEPTKEDLMQMLCEQILLAEAQRQVLEANVFPDAANRHEVRETNRRNGRMVGVFKSPASEERFAREFAQRVADQGPAGTSDWWPSMETFAKRLTDLYQRDPGNSCRDCLRVGGLPAVRSLRKLVGKWSRAGWLRITMERKQRAVKANSV